MIKASELRIGNWYLEFGVPKAVTAEIIFRLSNVEQSGKIAIDVSPIPLTEEWLLRFGFKSAFEGEVFVLSEDGGVGDFDFHIFKAGNDFYWDAGKMPCVYLPFLHDLQNLYKQITQLELEVK